MHACMHAHAFTPAFMYVVPVVYNNYNTVCTAVRKSFYFEFVLDAAFCYLWLVHTETLYSLESRQERERRKSWASYRRHFSSRHILCNLYIGSSTHFFPELVGSFYPLPTDPMCLPQANECSLLSLCLSHSLPISAEQRT